MFWKNMFFSAEERESFDTFTELENITLPGMTTEVFRIE